MAILLSLTAALCFGISDVAGAVAARRDPPVVVALGLQVAGFPLLAVGLILLPSSPSLPAIALGGLAGSAGSVGLMLYLRSMAVGPVGVISPISALLGVTVPVSWGVMISGEELSNLQVVGALVGIAAVVLVAWSPGASAKAYGKGGALIALIAGTLFGLFFVTLDATPADSGLWPLVAARIAGTLVILAMLRVTRRPASDQFAWATITLSGAMDATAIILFLLATRSGLLSLASLLTSLYPVVALLLARQLLNERLTRLQATGVTLALAATVALVV